MVRGVMKHHSIECTLDRREKRGKEGDDGPPEDYEVQPAVNRALGCMQSSCSFVWVGVRE